MHIFVLILCSPTKGRIRFANNIVRGSVSVCLYCALLLFPIYLFCVMCKARVFRHHSNIIWNKSGGRARLSARYRFRLVSGLGAHYHDAPCKDFGRTIVPMTLTATHKCALSTRQSNINTNLYEFSQRITAQHIIYIYIYMLVEANHGIYILI